MSNTTTKPDNNSGGVEYGSVAKVAAETTSACFHESSLLYPPCLFYNKKDCYADYRSKKTPDRNYIILIKNKRDYIRVILGCCASVTNNYVVVCSEPRRGFNLIKLMTGFGHASRAQFLITVIS